MSGLADFVGVPFSAGGRSGEFDCWGLVREALRACAGLHLPDYGKPYRLEDHETVASNIREGLLHGWERVEDPRLYDVVVFNIAGQPRHIGLMIGPSRFLHAPEWVELPDGSRVAGTSRIEHIDDRMWHKRIEGFYRHVG